jgi:hypothetical protein
LGTIKNLVKLSIVLGVVTFAFQKVTDGLAEFSAMVDTAHSDLNAIIAGRAGVGAGESGLNASSLAKVIRDQISGEGGFVAGILSRFGLGRDEFFATFKTLAANILADRSISAAERKISLAQLMGLKEAIIATGLTDADRANLRAQLDGIYAELIKGFAKIPAGDAEGPLGPFLDEAGNYLADIAANTEGTESAVQKWLDALKPTHRAGEKGRSRQSAEFAAIERLDPSRTDKITAALADLVAHYKKQPIGTKEHPREWIQRSFKGIFPDIAAALRTAMRSGDQSGVNKIVDSLRSLKQLGVHLPPGIRRLINRADKQAKEAEETKVAVNRMKTKVASGLERNLDKIQDVKAAIQRKRLSATFKYNAPKFDAGNVYVSPPKVYATIGARTLVRNGRTTVAYGPSYQTGGSGTYTQYVIR